MIKHLFRKFRKSNITRELLHYSVLFRGTDDTSVVFESYSLIQISRAPIFWQSGGPSWEVKLGREDSLTASQEDSNNIMPSPRANASFLIKLFHQFNLSIIDLVALSGSHSIGKARCFSIVFRLYNQSGTGQPDPEIDLKYRKKLDELCPKDGDENMTGGLDATPVVFDNQYFKDLVQKKGFLNSDQTLYSGDARTRKVVKKFSHNQAAFFSAFIEGMVKMGDLQSDKRGEIRRNCRVVNDWLSHSAI